MSITRKFISLALLILALFCVGAAAQETKLEPLAENASLDRTRDWLVENIRKHASFKTRINSTSVSDVEFKGCSLSLTVVRKTAVAAQDLMGVRRRTQTVKNELAFDFGLVEPDGIRLSDYILPEFQTITISFRPTAGASDALMREHDLIVRREAGEALRDGLAHARSLCTAGT